MLNNCASDAIGSDSSFRDFMVTVLGAMAEARPAFYQNAKSTSREGDGYAVNDKDPSGKEGWDGIESNMPRQKVWSAVGQDVCQECDSYCTEDWDEDTSETTTTLSFTITGPTDFANEVSRDVHRILLNLRGDAVAYSQSEYEEDADSLVSVSVTMMVSTD